MKNKSGIITRATSLALAFLASIGGSALAADLQYNFQEIRVPGSTNTVAHGINNRGDIVGVYDTGGLPSGFLLRQGVYTTIMVPGSILTTALGINNAGDIVGDFVDAAFAEHTYLLRNGQFTIIDFPGAAATDRPAINDRGYIVGVYFTADDLNVAHGYLLTPDGAFHIIAYPGVAETGATSINNRGDIVGVWDNDIFFNFRGFILTDGGFVNLDYPGAIGELGGSFPIGINSSGQLAGLFNDAVGGHGYVLDHGVFTPIDAPAGVPGTTGVFGINDLGQLVGKYRNPTLAHRVGFIATPVR